MKKKVVKKTARKKKLRWRDKIQTAYLHSLYEKEFFNKLPKVVQRLKKIRKTHPFDAIAFTGTSGMGYGFPLSFLLKIPVIHVRKKNKSHCNYAIEGTLSSKRYLIVDDFIETGATVKRIKKVIKDYSPKSIPVGIFLYDGIRFEDCAGLPVFTMAAYA
jgi:adenine/guanine phosphoribosyltransferase-like PRPP-binding protein